MHGSLYLQRGMTMWGMAFVILTLGSIVFLGLNLFPAYMEDFKVRSALDSVVKAQGGGPMSKASLVDGLQKRFDVDNITGVTLPRDLFVEPRGKNTAVAIRYEVVVPLFYNVSVLLDFNHTREVRGVE